MGQKLVLLDERRHDGSSLHLVAALDGDGVLHLDGHDLGPVTGPVSPRGEYEYSYRVQAGHLPALVAALGGAPGDDILAVLRDRWAGPGSYGLGEAIRASGVPFSFWVFS